MTDPLAAELRMTRFEVERLKAELAAARAVVEAARAFKIHGVAKDGAHAMFLFKALLSYDKVRGKGEA